MPGRFAELERALYAFQEACTDEAQNFYSIRNYDMFMAGTERDTGEVPESVAWDLYKAMDRLRNLLDHVTIEIDGSTDPDILARPIGFDRLAEITGLVNAATKDEWKIVGERDEDGRFVPRERLGLSSYRIRRGLFDHETVTIEGTEDDTLWADTRLIAESRQIIKELVTEVWRLRALDELKSRTSCLPDPEPQRLEIKKPGRARRS